MNLTATTINYEGRKNPKLYARRKQLKNLKLKEAELNEKCKQLQADCEALELPLTKVTTLAYDNPKTPIVSKLWTSMYDMQYNLLYGSYPKYKESKKSFAKDAVENLELLKYVNSPFQLRGSISCFSKLGRNIIKNKTLDFFRLKTPEEKQLKEYYMDCAKNKTKYSILGYK